jgi:hypothetical protein
MTLIKFTNNKLKKIVNVYQLNYLNGQSQGLGDYIRGCFCFNQIANLLGLEFEIDVSNHPMAKYLENSYHIQGIDYNNIETIFQGGNKDQFNSIDYEGRTKNINPDFLNQVINWLNSKDCEVYAFFSNAFPSFFNHKPECKILINSKLQPNEFLRNYIDYTLNELGLTKKGYGVIHVRTGDHHLKNESQIHIDFINKIKNIINKLISPGRRYLILSDSNIFKKHMKSVPQCYTLIRKIEHLGGECIKNTETNGVMNTLLEFFLMSHSNAIISMSVYDHISGFSKYCGILYDIPFNYIKIKELQIWFKG